MSDRSHAASGIDAETLQRGLDQLAIQRVINDYGRGVDEGDWDRVRDCFHPDATIEYGARGCGPRDETIEWLRVVTPALFGLSHYFGVPIVDFEAGGEGMDDRARCETWCLNVVQYPRSPAGEEKQEAMGLLYRDVFTRREGAWRILERSNATEWHLSVDGNSRLPPFARQASVQTRRPDEHPGKEPR